MHIHLCKLILINHIKFKNNYFSPYSILNSQLLLSSGSLTKSFNYAFHEGAAIPPNKLSGSSLLYKIIKVDPLL